MSKETLTVKFDGQNHQVDVQTFAYSVLNFATVVKEVNKKEGGAPLEIQIKSPEKGSLLVDLVTTVSNVDPTLIPQGVDFVANIIEIVGGAYLFHKNINGKKIEKKEKIEDKIKIELDDGSSLTVAENVYNIYVNNPSIPTSISQNFAALNEDPAVTNFSVIRNDSKVVDVDKEDFPRLAIKQQIETDDRKNTIEPANLYIYKMVFDKTDRKWEFYYRGNRISANISDDTFYEKIDAGESFAKGDQLETDLQINQVLDETIGTYVNHSYEVVKVRKHIKRIEPPQLPFDTTI